jgi:hypothetical protein
MWVLAGWFWGKQDFGLDWMLSRSRGNFMIWLLNNSYWESRRASRVAQVVECLPSKWEGNYSKVKTVAGKAAAVTLISQHKGIHGSYIVWTVCRFSYLFRNNRDLVFILIHDGLWMSLSDVGDLYNFFIFHNRTLSPECECQTNPEMSGATFLFLISHQGTKDVFVLYV